MFAQVFAFVVVSVRPLLLVPIVPKATISQVEVQKDVLHLLEISWWRLTNIQCREQDGNSRICFGWETRPYITNVWQQNLTLTLTRKLTDIFEHTNQENCAINQQTNLLLFWNNSLRRKTLRRSILRGSVAWSSGIHGQGWDAACSYRSSVKRNILLSWCTCLRVSARGAVIKLGDQMDLQLAHDIKNC